MVVLRCSSAALQHCLSTAGRNICGGRSWTRKIPLHQSATSLCGGSARRQVANTVCQRPQETFLVVGYAVKESLPDNRRRHSAGAQFSRGCVYRSEDTHPPAHLSGTGDHGRRERAKSTHVARGPLLWLAPCDVLSTLSSLRAVDWSLARSLARSVDHAARGGCGKPTLRAPQLVRRRRAEWPACSLPARQTVYSGS